MLRGKGGDSDVPDESSTYLHALQDCFAIHERAYHLPQASWQQWLLSVQGQDY